MSTARHDESSAVLIVNTQSRKGERDYADAKRLIEASGLTLSAAYPVRHAERIQEIVRGILADGHKFIIVGGGDGTISAVVDHFAYCDAVFGLLPLGTANSFCRTLGIPLDLPGAVDVLVNGKVANIDLGKINEDYFANGASIGLPAAVGRGAPPHLKRWLGRLGYLIVAANKFASHKPFRCILKANGRVLDVGAFDIRIASGSYQGGVLMAPETRPDDGSIVVHVITGPSKWAVARDWGRKTFGLPFAPSDMEVVRATEIRAIVAAVAELGRSLGIRTIAEGVETESQMEYVRAQGCTECQGYLFSPPVPAQTIDDLIELMQPNARSQRLVEVNKERISA